MMMETVTGKKNDSIVAYFAPADYADKYGDCNDNNPSIHPGATEQPCNEKDDNCNSKVDENRPAPTVTPLGNLDICTTGSVQLQTNANSGFTYQWKRNGKNISGATQRKYTATMPGIYKVLITYQGSCSNISEGITVTKSCISATSNEENSSAALAIFPNPSKDLVTLTYHNISAAGKITIKIFDRVGNLVFTRPDNVVTGINSYKLDLSRLQPGVYHAEINNGSSSIGNKLIIER